MPGGSLAVAHDGGEVTIYSAAGAFEEVRRLPSSDVPVAAITVGPELQIVTASFNGTVTVYSDEGRVDFVRQFELAESLADQAPELLASNDALRELFRELPVSVVPFALDEGLLIAVGAQLHRLGWGGDPVGTPTLVVWETPRPRGSMMTLPAPTPTNVVVLGDRVFALNQVSVLDFNWDDAWGDVTGANLLRSALDAGEGAMIVLGGTSSNLTILSRTGLTREFDLTSGDETLSSSSPVIGIREATLSPDDAVLASVTNDGIQLTSLLDGAPLAISLDRLPTSSSLSISPDGRTVAMGPTASLAPFDVRARNPDGRFVPAFSHHRGSARRYRPWR